MWLDKLYKMNKDMSINGNLSYLNLNFELHRSIYLIEILKDIIKFKMVENKLKIYFKDNCISFDRFYHWWQIDRCKGISDEEKNLINNYEKNKNNYIKLNNELNNNTESDKKEELKEKINKLDLLLKKETPLLKKNLELISRYKNLYPSKDLLKKVIENISLYLKYI